MTEYRCTECGARDSDRTNTPPASLICTNNKCRAGSDARDTKRGMFPVKDGYYPWGEVAPKHFSVTGELT